jgi:protein-glutamine gamma-glutamyltransferase
MAVFKPRETVTSDLDTRVLTSQSEGRDVFHYRVYSTPRNSRTDSGAEARQAMRRGDGINFEETRQRFRKLPDVGLERLIELARDLTRSEKRNGDEGDIPEQSRARTLERHLRDSGQYGYSLNMAITDDKIDPVEDFLFNRRRGHCEYFASALALMLRAVDIPSRLITGFKGADPLADKGNYEVQQRHAHAWVEAYLDERWIILDPTPTERDDSVRERSARSGFWAATRDSLSAIWSNYVVALSLDRQQQALYEPLRGSVSTGWGAVRRTLQGVAAAMENVKSKLSSPKELLTPQSAILSVLIIAAAVAIVGLGRRLWSRERFPAGRRARSGWVRRFFDWLATHVAGRPPDPARIVVAFYEQFQMLVSHAGLTPRNDQTQREFAWQVEETLNARLVAAGLQRFPGELAELFYRVRFGDGTLHPLETAEIENRLNRLRAALLPKRSAVSPS